MGKKENRKGGRFENRVCKELSLVWSLGSNDRVFIRNRQRVVVDGGRVVQWCGDIVQLQVDDDLPKCPFVFELKHWKQFYILTAFFKGTGRLMSWWQQLKAECPSNRIPVLVCRRDYDLTYTIFPATSDVLRVCDCTVLIKSKFFESGKDLVCVSWENFLKFFEEVRRGV